MFLFFFFFCIRICVFTVKIHSSFGCNFQLGLRMTSPNVMHVSVVVMYMCAVLALLFFFFSIKKKKKKNVLSFSLFFFFFLLCVAYALCLWYNLAKSL